jgi:transcriptional regulator with XRE-family HTH domain
LRIWRKGKGLSQEALGRKLGFGDQWKTYQSYESGRNPWPEATKEKLRRMGYQGPFEEEIVSEPVPAYVTREDFAEWKGFWKGGEEKVLQLLRDLDRRLRELEKRAGISE